MSSPPGWPRLHDDALHGIFGEAANTIGPFTEADRAGLVANMLVMFGNSVGAGPYAVADGARHPSKLMAITAGATSRGRKGTATTQTGRLFSEVDPEWWRQRVFTGLASGEGLIAALRDPADDAAEAGDKRALVIEPEFARVTRAAGRESSTLSATIRQAWDSPDLRVMTRHDPLEATGTHISMIAHVTIEEYRKCATDTDAANGFLNRYLNVCVQRSQLLPSGAEIPESDFVRLIRLFRNALDGARRAGLVRRNPAAEELWGDLYVTMAETELPGLAGAITSRAEAQVLRLSLIYALGDGSRFIGPDHLLAAWAFWRYCEDSAAFIFGDALGAAVADRLLVALQQAGTTGLTLTAQSALFDRHVKKEELDAARFKLEHAGRAVKGHANTAGRGRPAEVWFYCEKEKEVSLASNNGSAA